MNQETMKNREKRKGDKFVKDRENRVRDKNARTSHRFGCQSSHQIDRERKPGIQGRGQDLKPGVNAYCTVFFLLLLVSSRSMPVGFSVSCEENGHWRQKHGMWVLRAGLQRNTSQIKYLDYVFQASLLLPIQKCYNNCQLNLIDIENRTM